VSSAEQLVAELERTIDELARDTWGLDAAWCRARLAEFYEQGTAGEDAVRDAELWFLLDCPLPDGQTPIWRMRQERPELAVELLARSEIRAWRIESPALAVCALSGDRVRLEPARGAIDSGAVAVGRSIPLGPERWLLLGNVSSVGAGEAPAFERFIRALHAPVGEFWRVHGGVLARAALEWPSPALGLAA
jgi:hypothetical protein